MSLDSPSRLKCVICDRKSCSLAKKGRQRKENFRKTRKRNRFQQRWTRDCVEHCNSSSTTLKPHYGAYVCLGIEPKVSSVDGEFHLQKTSASFFEQSNVASEFSSLSESENESSKNMDETPIPNPNSSNKLDAPSQIASAEVDKTPPFLMCRVKRKLYYKVISLKSVLT